jgi:geranylgeranylglycerol-phosphate geranylgeranyltransferase
MAYVTMLRPINCIITLVSVWVGAWIGIGYGFTLPPALILAGMIGFTTCGFGNLINDLYDINIDKVNNPQRPLPAGKVNPKLVVILALCLLIISLAFSLSINITVFFLVLGVSILLFTYAAFLKKTTIANIIVSAITGLSFILGGIVVKNPVSVFPFIFSFFIHMPREIIKDIIDIKGDQKNNVVSIPIALGIERASIISVLFLGVLCILLPLPYILEILSVRYMIVVLFFAYPIIIYCLIRLVKKPAAGEFSKLSRFLKFAMATGLVAMFI